MSGGYHCRWCPFAAVVPSLVDDHEKTCPMRPGSDAEEATP